MAGVYSLTACTVKPKVGAGFELPSDMSIRESFDYLFGDVNYAKDNFLKSLRNQHGWTPIAPIAKFNRFKNIPVSKLIAALKNTPSRILEIHTSRLLIRRKDIFSRIRSSIHFWFSDANWNADLFLQHVAEKNHGMFPLEELLKFKSLKALFDLEKISIAAEAERYIQQALLTSKHVIVGPCADPHVMGVCRKTFPRKVLDLFEFYFGEQYFQDRYLLELARENADSFVPIKEIMKWPAMAKLVKPTQQHAMASVLLQSKIVEVSADGLRVRKRGLLLSLAEQDTGAAAADASIVVVGSAAVHAHTAVPPPTFFSSFPPAATAAHFTAIQFNILAQFFLADNHSAIAQWPYRLNLLLTGLRTCNADIVCLQEVQGTPSPNHHSNHATVLMNEAKKMGYDSLYFRKTNSDGSQKKYADIGNLLLYKTSAFHLVDERTLAYAQILSSMSLNGPQFDHYVHQKQGAVVAKLQHVATKKMLLVANTHISCNFNNPDTQVVQVAVLTTELKKCLLENEALLICGDFNSMPGSGVYDFMSHGLLLAGHPDLIPKDPAIAPIFPPAGISHDLALSSTFVSVNGAEPALTNLKGPPENFMACLDYIWHNQHLKPVSVMPVPSFTDMSQENGNLLNSKNPSDHLPLGASFMFL